MYLQVSKVIGKICTKKSEMIFLRSGIGKEV